MKSSAILNAHAMGHAPLGRVPSSKSGCVGRAYLLTAGMRDCLILAAAMLSVASAQGTFQLQLLPPATEGRCLDGSMGGYWISKGTGDGANRFIWHFQGGGWCINEEDCLGRSKTSLGSSSSWPQTGTDGADGGVAGMFSPDASVNPHFWNWTKVFVGYCDGASYAGTVMTPVNVSGTLIYFRGRYIMDGILQDLIDNHGLEQASDLVVKGCSAGGLAAYLHADYIRSRLPQTVRVVAMPGAGFFLDIPALNGQYLYTPHYQYVFTMQNVSGSVNSACIAAYNSSEQWRCFMAEYTLPHMQVPVFVSNALWDSWQAGNIMGLGCDPAHAGSCNAAELAYVADFRTAMIQRLGPIFANPQNGAFLQTCFVHVVEDIDVSWHNTTVAGQTQSETFWSWYSGGTALSRTAVDGPSVNPACYGN